MKYFNTLLFIYCSLFIFLLVVSGITTAKSPTDLLLLLVFFPIILHFVITIFHQLRRKKQEGAPAIKDQKRFSFFSTSFLLTCILFLLLFSISVFQIINKTTNDQQALLSPISTEPQEKITPTSQVPKLTSLLHIVSPDDSLINVRTNASSSASILLKVKNDQTFPLLSKQGVWYEVQLPDGKKGFVNEKFAVEKP